MEHTPLQPLPGPKSSPFADLADLCMAGPAAAFRAELAELLAQDQLDPARLIGKLKQIPRLSFLYEQDSRVMENYTIAEHTAMVLSQFERHLSDVRLPALVSRSDIRLALALHDIGKPIPADKRDQHRETLAVLESIADHLPWSEDARCALEALLGGDPIGTYLRGFMVGAPIDARLAIAAKAREEDLTFANLAEFAALVTVEADRLEVRAAARRAAEEISVRALRAGMSLLDFWEIQRLYYQADTSAYTYDAKVPGGKRASPGLDFLYELNPGFSFAAGIPLLVHDPTRGGLKFSERIGILIAVLEEEIRNQ